jgi:hypothetical protein
MRNLEDSPAATGAASVRYDDVRREMKNSKKNRMSAHVSALPAAARPSPIAGLVGARDGLI